jgi:enoyl-CoA hydratase
MVDYSRYETIRIEKADRVATVTLNRPDSLNAVNPVMHRELCNIWLDIAMDDEVNAIILTASPNEVACGIRPARFNPPTSRYEKAP